VNPDRGTTPDPRKLVAKRGQQRRAGAKCLIARSWFGRDARAAQGL